MLVLDCQFNYMENGDGLESLDGRMMRGLFEWQMIR
jgi:hypothetical protein